VLSQLAVLPKYQGKGIGKKLMLFCADMADEAGVPTYLTAFPGAHDMYLKLGYTDVLSFDMDLNEYGRKNRGFGVYRSSGMIRHPPENEEK
jgi:predicted N-acetyltransferase YhbS